MGLDISLIVPDYEVEVFNRGITHNLNKMAKAVGIYKHLWRPEEYFITKPSQLIKPLTTALNTLKSKPEVFKKYNPKNGWGNYDNLVDFVSAYLYACIKYPNTNIQISR